MDLTYEEFKEFLSYYQFSILIPSNTEFSDEEWDIIVEKFVSSNEYVDVEIDDYIREEMNLAIEFQYIKYTVISMINMYLR